MINIPLKFCPAAFEIWNLSVVEFHIGESLTLTALELRNSIDMARYVALCTVCFMKNLFETLIAPQT